MKQNQKRNAKGGSRNLSSVFHTSKWRNPGFSIAFPVTPTQLGHRHAIDEFVSLLSKVPYSARPETDLIACAKQDYAMARIQSCSTEVDGLRPC